LDHFSTNLMVFFRAALDDKAHSYRLDRLDKGQDLEARQLLETWLAARRPLAMSKWMEQVKEAGHIPAQRVGMLAICQLQETSNRKLKVNAVGCRQAFGLLS
jgi:hypothetical protein